MNKHIVQKFAAYLEARARLPGYENAPIGFRFTDQNVTPQFRAAVETTVDRLRQANPGVDIRVEWRR